MRYRVLNNGILEFFDATANTVGSIGANGTNMKITANNGVIELGNTPSDVQVGTVGTLTNWTFLGGGTIGAGGIGTISMGQSGDTVNMNVSGVVYQYPSSFLRFNEISGANNKINITTQVPGSVILTLPNRPVVGALTLTDNIISTSNTTGTLTVGGGIGITGNVNVSNTFSIITESAGNRPFTMQPGVSGSLGARFGVPQESMDLYTTGGYPFWFATNGPRSAIQLGIATVSSAVNYLQIAGNTTGGSPILSAQGSDTNVGINLLPKGNGSANITSTANSTSNTSGALVVRGGMGITGNLFMSAANNYFATTTGQSYRLGWTDNYFQRDDRFSGMTVNGTYFAFNTQALVQSPGYLSVRTFIHNDSGNGTVIFASGSPVRLQNTAASTSNTTGSLIVGGGIGVSGNIYSSNNFILGTIPSQTFSSIPTSRTSTIGLLDTFNLYVNGPSSGYLFLNAPGSASRVGVNTLTPQYTFDVNGTIRTTDMIVSGNLTVVGNVSSENVQSLSVSDPLIKLGIGNYTSDLRDIGFAAHYNDGTNAHTGFIRDSGTKEYYVFQGYTPELDSNNNVIITDPSFSLANVYSSTFKGNVITGGTNFITVSGNTTANAPTITSEGTDTNIDINIRPKGTGAVNVRSSGSSTYLNVTNPTALAIVNVTVSGACTRSQIITFAPGNGSEANLLIYTTGLAGLPPATAKISSTTGKSTIQVEGGQSASINIITLGASSTATANLQIRSGIGGSFSGDAGILIYGKTNSLKLIHTGSASGSRFDMGGDSPAGVGADFATANITSSLVDGTSSLRIIGGNRADFKLSANGTSGFTSFDVESIGTSTNPVYANVSSTFGGVNVQILGAQAGGFAGFANMRMFARSTANLIIESGSSGFTPGASLKIFGAGSAPAYANIGSTTSAASQVNIISSLPSTSNSTGALVVQGGVGVSGNVYVGGTTVSNAGISFANSLLINSNRALTNYGTTHNVLGLGSGNTTIDLTLGNFVSANCNGITTWTFSNPLPSPIACGFILELTNGGSATQNWPSVKWPGGTAPTLTASGVDVLTFITDDGGTIWRGVVSMLDSK